MEKIDAPIFIRFMGKRNVKNMMNVTLISKLTVLITKHGDNFLTQLNPQYLHLNHNSSNIS